jgi:hypothetical protein
VTRCGTSAASGGTEHSAAGVPLGRNLNPEKWAKSHLTGAPTGQSIRPGNTFLGDSFDVTMHRGESRCAMDCVAF